MPFLPFVYGYPSSSPHRPHCTPNKSVPTLRYTHRPGPIYMGPCPRALTECSPLDFRRSSIITGLTNILNPHHPRALHSLLMDAQLWSQNSKCGEKRRRKVKAAHMEILFIIILFMFLVDVSCLCLYFCITCVPCVLFVPNDADINAITYNLYSLYIVTCMIRSSVYECMYTAYWLTFANVFWVCPRPVSYTHLTLPTRSTV